MRPSPPPAGLSRPGLFGPRFVVSMAALATCGLLSVSVASAQGIPVRSGEHNGFTRIVVDFPRPTDWVVTREAAGFRVTFTPAPRRFDLSRVFDLIPRTRVERVAQSPTDGSLLLYSSCDCELEAFDAGSDAVAFDIKDAPESDAADRSVSILPIGLTVKTTAALRPFPPPFTPSSPPGFSTSLPEETTYPVQPGTATDDRISSRAGQPEAGARPEQARNVPSLSDDLSEEMRARALAQALRADLERAAQAGLIDVPAPRLSDRDTESPPPPDVRAPDAVLRSEPQRAGDQENLRLRTAHDIWSDEAREIFGKENSCLSPGAFDFFSAANPRRLLGRLPDLRAALVDARGTVSPSGARALGEAYLALGFGAEAAIVLRDANLPGVWASRFQSLTRIVDLGGDRDEAAWAGATACASPIAMWAVLGQAPGVPTDALNDSAVQSAFFDLPSHLRIHLAEDLADRLRAAGHPLAADAVTANAEMLRVPSPVPAEARDQGDPVMPERALAADPAITPGSQEIQVRNLLHRIAEALSADLAPKEGDLDLADAMLTEYRGTEEGRRLADALAIRQMKNGEIESVLERLSRLREHTDPAWSASVERGLASALMAGRVSALLEATLHPRAADLLRILSDDQSTRAAERLIEAGFPETAAQVLRLAGERDATEAPVMTARAALGAGDPARALALLAGRTDAEAGTVRAQALAALGNHRGAAEAYAAAGDAENAARSAWLSGEADLIGEFGTPAQRETMTSLGRLEDMAPGAIDGAPQPEEDVVGAPPPSNEDTREAPEAGSLAAAAALLERSAERRAVLLEIMGIPR